MANNMLQSIFIVYTKHLHRDENIAAKIRCLHSCLTKIPPVSSLSSFAFYFEMPSHSIICQTRIRLIVAITIPMHISSLSFASSPLVYNIFNIIIITAIVTRASHSVWPWLQPPHHIRTGAARIFAYCANEFCIHLI